MKETLTIKDIADIADVSTATVSRVMNNHDNVSPEMREKVQAVIDQYQFEPNINAKNLKSKEQSAITLFVKGMKNLLFADIVEQIQLELRQVGEELSLVYLDEDDNEVLAAEKYCISRKPRGLIFLGSDLNNFSNRVLPPDIPAVLLTNHGQKLSGFNLSSFTTNDQEAAGLMIEHLIKKGHSRIGILGGNLFAEQISYKRLQGSINKLKENQIDFEIKKQFEPCRFSMQQGYQAVRKLLERNSDLTAIFALSDLIAIGALRGINDLGLSVPEDISLAGFDGLDLAKYSVPRLTTIKQNKNKMVKLAIDDLLRRIHYDRRTDHQFIDVTILEGESIKNLKEER